MSGSSKVSLTGLVLFDITLNISVHSTCFGQTIISHFILVVFADAPEIRATSSCASVVDMMTCECIVESQPPSTVHFMLPERVLPSIKVEHHGNAIIGTLQIEMGRYESVLCLANNTQGNASLTIMAPPVYSKVTVSVYESDSMN